IHGDFIRCMAMSMNGERIAITTVITVRRRMVRHGPPEIAVAASCAAVPRSTIRGIFARLTATGTPRFTATTLSAFGWPERLHLEAFELLCRFGQDPSLEFTTALS